MQNYRFSFTAASLLVTEFVTFAQQLRESKFDYETLEDESIARERQATRIRESRELRLRMKQLSQAEINCLVETTVENQKLIAFLACVRLYRIVREFIEEVIWDKMAVFDNKLTNRDATAFFYQKSLEHKEIAGLSESTRKKVEQLIFKMLEQAGLINNVRSKELQIPFLDYSLQNLLSDTDKKYLLNL